MMGVHTAIVHHARRRVVEGVRHPKLAAEVRARADEALALLDAGLEEYAIKG
jgi:hypothetical protein